MIDKFRGEYFFLSNMYPVLIEVEGETYPSAEHAFQAMKTNDPEERFIMSLCRSPEEAKKAGRIIDLRPDWESVKVEKMYSILKSKFSNPKLKEKLIATSDQEIVEGNTWGDTFWGVCKGEGKNTLGILLMKVRKELA